ncbi:AlpA family phage regulatory protein [Bradyrhizobium yuanmingense]|uniref:helix-turn-helix transcriptional regulator n=1 Tax=Bradyrhizobium yuanmingense TaxID=108015 RepID=UPI0021A79850|nr:AlpA family phage regulatory protein [Bradyrhizobium sp. CB1024]UWU84928.1 AlpA family phage regulatory protein [Bradyrhizobium sp. CB1024]
MQSLYPAPRLLRLKDILHPGGPLPLSKSSFYSAIKEGRVPAPIKLGRASAWRAEDVRKLIEEGIPRAGLATRTGDKS